MRRHAKVKVGESLTMTLQQRDEYTTLACRVLAPEVKKAVAARPARPSSLTATLAGGAVAEPTTPKPATPEEPEAEDRSTLATTPTEPDTNSRCAFTSLLFLLFSFPFHFFSFPFLSLSFAGQPAVQAGRLAAVG